MGNSAFSLKEEELNQIKNKITTQLEELREKVAQQTHGRPSDLLSDDAVRGDAVDVAQAILDYKQVIDVNNRDKKNIQELLLALINMQTEDFGLCLSCDAPISFRRLLAAPTTKYCLACQEEKEYSQIGTSFF